MMEILVIVFLVVLGCITLKVIAADLSVRR